MSSDTLVVQNMKNAPQILLISDPDVTKNHYMGQGWYVLYYGILEIAPSQWHNVFVKTD